MSPGYRLDRYDFQELYTKNPEEDASSLAEKKAFRFKYRLATDSLVDYERRQTRVVKRSFERSEENKLGEVQVNISAAISQGNKELEQVFMKQYQEIIEYESVKQYKDYYESDGEGELAVVDQLAAQDIAPFISGFEDYTKAPSDTKSYATIPKREWNNSFGVWRNFLFEIGSYTTQILPQARVMANIGETLKVSNMIKKEMIESNTAGGAVTGGPQVESKSVDNLKK